ncbi:MAG: integrin alpha [Planctomycetota bacterium]
MTPHIALLAASISPVLGAAVPNSGSDLDQAPPAAMPAGRPDGQAAAQPAKTPDSTDVPAGWWQQVQEDIRQSEYHVTWQTRTSLADVPAAYQAPNRAHNLRTYFTPQGIRVLPRSGDAPGWEWGLKLAGYGRGEALPEPTAAELAADGNRMEYRREALTEWYVNDPRGLEQGFTLARSPSPFEREGWGESGTGEPLRIELTITGNLRGTLRADGRCVEFTTAGGVRVLDFGELHATDALGGALPARFDWADGCLALLVDDAGAVYPITVDPLATTPDWTAESDQAYAHFGCSVATAGDVDGDGYADVIVGAYLYDNGGTDEGRAFVYHGSASGLSTSANWTAEGDQVNAHFGWSVATAGNVNGDAYSDVIVGAYGYDNGQDMEGRAFVYHGSASGLSAAANWTAESNQDGALFGYSVATAGDVNSDGYSDVIVGAPDYNNGQSDEGRAFVYHGSASGLSAAANWTAEGNQDGANFGTSVATAGDVNGDGRSDVIVGAPYYDNGQPDEGRAFVYHGSASGLSAAASWTAESDQASARFGYSVSTAGDVNGDAYDDVIVGAYSYDNGGTDEGRAFVYHGSASGLGAAANWTAESDQDGAYFGASVATAGDVNGDGYGDVIVGAHFYDDGQDSEGWAFVYQGSASGLSATPDWTAESDQALAGFGWSVATAGDVNGDGYSDVIVGAYWYTNGEAEEGRAFVFHGSGGGINPTPNWTGESDQASARLGCSVATAGDVNGDGYSDVIVGAYLYDNGQANEGRAFVYHGSASGPSATANWTAESDQANAEFGGSVMTAGDVNGDGYSDVIVGAHYYDNGQNNEGRAFVYHGSGSGLSAAANWTAESNQANADFGGSVMTAGDVNGDGYSDVIVGAPLYDNGELDEGRAFVYHGSAAGLSAAANWWAESNQAGACFGYSVATAGDVNGNGYADVIVGAFCYDSMATDEGWAFVYHGSPSGLSSTPNWWAHGRRDSEFFGRSVSTAGDVDGDGYSDVIVGADGYDGGQTNEGAAFVYHGSASGLSTTADWMGKSDQESAGFGYSVATAGDVNGDGYADVVVGAYYYDNGQYQEGGAFLWLGSASGLGADGTPANADWAAEGNQAGAYFGRSVGTAGDVNGDGFSDLIVGAYRYDNGQTDEGRAFLYYGSPSGLSATANWTAEGNQDSARFGISAGTAGDVNGDGYSDVIVGAYFYDNGQANEGRAFVYHGSATGLSTTSNWTAESNQDGALFGWSVATAGDVNNDGYSDVIVGAYLYGNDQNQEGRAFVYHGSASGLSATTNWTTEGDQPGAEFGWSVMTAGDVNGDGYSDVIVGAPGYTNDQSDEGRAFVYHGSVSGLSAAANWTAESNQDDARFGTSVATAGDVNGDGYRDVIVGASEYDNGQENQGRAFVYHGSPSGLSTAPNWTAESDQGDAYFGRSVATAGDVNGDGYSDVMVGAPNYDNGEPNEGRAFVYHGSPSGLSTTPNWNAESDQGYASFGFSAATAGDVNGDGYSDVIVGAPTYDNKGRALVYYGSPSGASLAANWTAESDQGAAGFGYSVATAGDVNGDGYSDVIVGAYDYSNPQMHEGRAFVYHGSQGGGMSLKPQQRQPDDSAPIAMFGRSAEVSSFRLAALGRTPFGRGRVALEWEVKPLGTLLDGTGTGMSSSYANTGVAGAELNELVAGLSEYTPYHWRVRLAYDPARVPFMPHSRWLTLPYNGAQETDLRTFPCASYAPPDGDHDCDVDLADLVWFELCLSGPAVPYGGGCGDRDFNGDGHVDLGDFGAFQGCYSGENQRADPDCAD